MIQNTEKRRHFEAQAFPFLEALYRTAWYVSDSESDAQDLVQESFARAYRSWHKYQFRPNRRIWLFKIMANALSNKYRPSPGLSAAANDADDIDGYLVHSWLMNQRPVVGSEQDLFSVISKDDVKRTIRDLPDDLRLVIVLSLLEGFSYQEIADIAGISLETVRFRIHKGRKLLQRELLDQMACEGNDRMTVARRPDDAAANKD